MVIPETIQSAIPVLQQISQVHSEVCNGQVRLYKAYVLPHLEYCSPLLLDIGNAETTKMEEH